MSKGVQKRVCYESLDTQVVGKLSSKWLFLQKIIPPSILVFFTALVYYPSLNYPFQFDDIANITKKFTIRFDNPLSRWWTNSRWFGDWLNYLNFKIGRFDPFSYRLVNVMIHILAGILLYFLILRLCRFLKNKPFFFDNAVLLAMMTSGLFLLHPVQTQTVSYVIQARIEGLATLFIIATVLFFIQMVSSKSNSGKILSIFLFIISGALSCGTKEIVVVIPFLLLLVDWFFISQERWIFFKKRLLVHLAFNICFILLLINYLGINIFIEALGLKTAVMSNRGNIVTSHALGIITPLHFLISEFKVILHYIFMFLWPFGISVEYDWKLTTSFFAFDSFFPFIFLFSLLLVVFRAMIKKKYSFFAFGSLWFFICIAPRSTIIPTPELVCDYKTYLASVGIFFIFSVSIVSVFTRLCMTCKMSKFIKFLHRLYLFPQSVYMLFIIIFFIPISVSTVLRNKVWSSSVEFWSDNAKKAPGKARVHNNYGVALSEYGNKLSEYARELSRNKKKDEAIKVHKESIKTYEYAIKAYKRAIELDKYYQDPLSNIAVAYSLKGETDKAINSLKKAIYLCPNYAEAYNNLGSLFLQKKEYVEAERVLKRAIAIRPYYGKAFYNLARLAEIKNQPEEVWNNLKKATLGDLDIPEVFFKLGQISVKLKRYKKAAVAFKMAINRGQGSQKTWFNLANSYFMLKDLDKAESIYEKLVRDNPVETRFIYNLAETLFAKNEYEKALVLFKKSTVLPRPIPRSFFRVSACLEKMKKVDEAKMYLKDLLTFDSTDKFKKMVKNEMTRMSLQESLNKGKGSIRLSDLKNVLANRDKQTL